MDGSMGYFAVAIPANLAFASFGHLVGYGRKAYVLVKHRMASDAVFLHHGSARVGNDDGLRFHPHREDGGVAHPIFSLEKVLACNVVVRYMAVVAGCPLAVRAVEPGGVLRTH